MFSRRVVAELPTLFYVTFVIAVATVVTALTAVTRCTRIRIWGKRHVIN
jgi:hypothetical protein